MNRHNDYQIKYKSLKEMPLFNLLAQKDRDTLAFLAFQYRLTFQEFKQILESARDMEQWKESSLETWWRTQFPEKIKTKKQLMNIIREYMSFLRSKDKEYPSDFIKSVPPVPVKGVIQNSSEKTIYGPCPVASPRTVCCNLKTIDVVENCPFACSYCTIQTFYQHSFIFDQHLKEKLDNIKLESGRFYHFGSGQSSDALAWGNKFGILHTLCNFAEKNPNILLEFKTKSDNIDYFIKTSVPKNIVISWTLNTPTIITNEEHHTVSLERRFEAAKKVALRGIKVAFHFHPVVYYKNWQGEYSLLVRELQKNFVPEDILFISFGSVTLIKPVLEKIRISGYPTKMTQMQMEKDPHGKFTYPDAVKVKMFRYLYTQFQKWHQKIFFYLCMEKESIWKSVFGFSYESNELFEAVFGQNTMVKIN